MRPISNSRRQYNSLPMALSLQYMVNVPCLVGIVTKVRKFALTLQAKARALAWRVNANLRTFVTIPTKQGTFTIYCKDNAIGRELYCRREFEMGLMSSALEFVHDLQPSLRAKGTVVDV